MPLPGIIGPLSFQMLAQRAVAFATLFDLIESHGLSFGTVVASISRLSILATLHRFHNGLFAPFVDAAFLT
jgi:uncharacterized membrane protein (DUF441 family)